MQTAVREVTVLATSRLACAGFFQRAFGWHYPQVDGRLAAPNIWVNFHEAVRLSDPRHPVNTVGITHVCVQAGHHAQLEARFAEAGARYLGREILLGTGYTYSYGVSPSGQLIELETRANFPQTPGNWVTHVGFCTPDAAGLARFYQHLFGGAVAGGQSFGPSPGLDMLSGLIGMRAIGYWLTGMNVSLEFWQFVTPATHASEPGSAGYAALTFEVANLSSVCQKLDALGMSYDRTAADALRFCDPDGNRIYALKVAQAGDSVLNLPHANIVLDLATPTLSK